MVSCTSAADRVWVGVELRHLATLVAIARTNSFGEAARWLGYTQSAISWHIASLERAVGVRLVSRSRGSRVVRLTPDGEILLAHAEAVTSELQLARERIADRSSEDPTITAVRLAASKLLTSVIPPLLALVRQEAPSSRLIVREFDEERGFAPFERPEIHLWLTTLSPIAAARLDGVRIATEPFVLLVPPQLESGETPSIDVLAKMPLAAPASGAAARRVDELFLRAKLHPSFVLRTDDASTLNALARDGLAAAIMPRLLVADDLAAGAHSLEELIGSCEVSIGWSAGREVPFAVRLVVAAAKKVIAARSEPALL